MKYITLEEEAIMKHFELVRYLWMTKLHQDAFIARMQSFDMGRQGEN